MRRTRARPGRRHVLLGIVRHRRGAVGDDQRRAVVAVAQRDPERVEVLALLGDVAGVLAAHDRSGLVVALDLGRRHHAGCDLEIVVGRLPRVAHGDGLPLGGIVLEVALPGPALQDPGQADAEIDPVDDAGVHAEAAGRDEQVRRVAGEQDAAALVAGGDQRVAAPRLHRDDLGVERSAEGVGDRRQGVDVVRRLVGAEMLLVVEVLAAVDRDEDAGRRRRDRPVERALPLVLELVEVRRPEIDADIFADGGHALQVEAEALADRAAAAVAADEIVRGDGVPGARGDVLELDVDLAPGILEARDPPAIVNRGVGRRDGEVAQDRLQRILADVELVAGRMVDLGVGLPKRSAVSRRFGVGREAEPEHLVVADARREHEVAGIALGISALDDAVHDPPAAEDLLAAHLQDVGARVDVGAVALVDDDAVDAAPSEFAGHGQSHGTGTGDENGRRCGQGHVNTS